MIDLSVCFSTKRIPTDPAYTTFSFDFQYRSDLSCSLELASICTESAPNLLGPNQTQPLQTLSIFKTSSTSKIIIDSFHEQQVVFPQVAFEPKKWTNSIAYKSVLRKQNLNLASVFAVLEYFRESQKKKEKC